MTAAEQDDWSWEYFLPREDFDDAVRRAWADFTQRCAEDGYSFEEFEVVVSEQRSANYLDEPELMSFTDAKRSQSGRDCPARVTLYAPEYLMYCETPKDLNEVTYASIKWGYSRYVGVPASDLP